MALGSSVKQLVVVAIPIPETRWAENMNRTTRPGFDAERKLTLDQDRDHGVIVDATPAERLAMVWPITESCWAFVPRVGENAEREFQRHVECIRRGRS
jgi:hypothetical protein